MEEGILVWFGLPLFNFFFFFFKGATLLLERSSYNILWNIYHLDGGVRWWGATPGGKLMCACFKNCTFKDSTFMYLKQSWLREVIHGKKKLWISNSYWQAVMACLRHFICISFCLFVCLWLCRLFCRCTELSSCRKQGPLPYVIHSCSLQWFLPCLYVVSGLCRSCSERRLSCPVASWDLPRPGAEPLSPMLGGRLFYHWASREFL